MAESKAIYPVLAVNNWWALRKRFKRSIPASVTPNYIATVLGVGEKSAINILPNLKRIGLINQEGIPTERAKKWRFDEEYQQVCADIINEIYPQELLDAVPDPVNDEDAAKNWFMREADVGEQASKLMARFYCLLSTADPSQEQDLSETASTKKEAAPNPADKTQTGTGEIENSASIRYTVPPKRTSQLEATQSIHINLQIHITADASNDQIDQIFASIARHLYGPVRGSE